MENMFSHGKHTRYPSTNDQDSGIVSARKGSHDESWGAAEERDETIQLLKMAKRDLEQMLLWAAIKMRTIISYFYLP
jgi:hypothetical protein